MSKEELPTNRTIKTNKKTRVELNMKPPSVKDFLRCQTCGKRFKRIENYYPAEGGLYKPDCEHLSSDIRISVG